jgi:hypothetical protein
MARSGAAAGKNLIIQNGKWLIPRTGFLFPAGERTGWTRVLMAAVVPAAMCIVLWLFVAYGRQSDLFDSMGEHLSCWNGKMGCLGLALIGMPVLAAGVVLLAGLLLRLAGVRPAWPVVFGGLAIALIIGHIYQRYFLNGAPVTLLAASLGVAGSYAAAAFLTMPQGYRLPRIGLAVAIVALLFVSLL